jgi:hypothetical protein
VQALELRGAWADVGDPETLAILNQTLHVRHLRISSCSANC